MNKVSLLIDYEKTMTLDSKERYKVVQKDQESNEGVKNAIYLLKYIFEYILEWSPYMIRDYFTPEISSWLHVKNCVNKIDFPPELDQNKDYFYVAHFLYPKILPYNKKKSVLEVYNRERLKKTPEFPRKFFQDKVGKENLDICLKYIISENFYSMDNKDIYDFFADNKLAKQFIAENYLTTPINNHYGDIFEAVHSVLPEGDKDETYYQYLRFNEYLKKKKINCQVVEEG